MPNSRPGSEFGQPGPEPNDLARHQWIPLACTALFLFLMAVCVTIAGTVASHYAAPVEEQAVPTVTLEPAVIIQPTSTLAPSPTPPPTMPAPTLLRVLPSSVNLRAGPSTSTKVIGQVKKGVQVRPVALSDDGKWVLVTNTESGATGWISGEFLETLSGDLKTLPTVAPIPP
jgi:hypothetical protein